MSEIVQPSEIEKPTNRLLAALPADELARLLSKTREVPLEFARIIHEQHEVVRCVYFPVSGIISLLLAVEERARLEVGIVGSEGFVGLSVFNGAKQSSNRAIVQGKGAALEMNAADFTAECDKGGALPRILERYTYSLLMQVSQLAACNRFHETQSRLARWLLMTGDCMKRDEFQITQEFLSDMLGVRREAVNKSATNLQRIGLINYWRGNVSILDRAGLEAAACRCYFIIKQEIENFLPGFKTRQKGC